MVTHMPIQSRAGARTVPNFMPRRAGGLQRQCACGGNPSADGECAECRQKRLQRKTAPAAPTAQASATAPPIVHEVLRSSGQPLDSATRRFLEPRFGHDFSQVRVHSGERAAHSARAVAANAYTVGRHIVFGAGQLAPETQKGLQLIGHELTHVVQQGTAEANAETIPIDAGSSPAEQEADGFAKNLTNDANRWTVRHTTPQRIARFSDTGHHVVEEAALAGAGFNRSQMKSIERGNVQRDYSQVGRIGNLALLCDPHDFGGYKPEEHFDNYIWDAVTGGWRTRGASALGAQGVEIGKTPIDYIVSQLGELASRGTTDAGLEHLGNAFHTIEDFFAHSNFVELMQGDVSHGATLRTGDPVGPSDSVPRILEGVTPRGIQEGYRTKAETAIETAAPGTHTAMAHDDPSRQNYALARRLAALVIQDLGTNILSVMNEPEPARSPLMRERVLAKITQYLRPPDPRDKWWEELIAEDKGQIDKRLDEAARLTPITVNQCALSPLKNLEASKDSPLALPIDVAIPTTILGNQAWFQVGVGVARPFPFEPLPGGSTGDDHGTALVAGAQLTGRF